MAAPWTAAKASLRKRATPAARFVARTGLTPNALTMIGLGLNVVAAAIVAAGWLQLGGIVFLLASAFDAVDGAVARATGSASRFGAFLDSVADRYAEAAIFAGLLAVFLSREQHLMALVATLALVGSLLVSYARARAEGLGLDCEIGLLQRPERVMFLVAGLVLPDLLLEPVVWVLAVATNITVVQRVMYVHRLLSEEPAQSRTPRP